MVHLRLGLTKLPEDILIMSNIGNIWMDRLLLWTLDYKLKEISTLKMEMASLPKSPKYPRHQKAKVKIFIFISNSILNFDDDQTFLTKVCVLVIYLFYSQFKVKDIIVGSIWKNSGMKSCKFTMRE